MDGEALAAAFASCPGVNCLRDVLPKFGQRLKVYNALKAVFEQFQVCFEGYYTIFWAGSKSESMHCSSGLSSNSAVL